MPENFLDEIGSDLAAAGDWLEAETKELSSDVWSTFGKAFRSFAPAQLDILRKCGLKVLADIEADPLVVLTPAEEATALLNYAALEEIDWLEKVSLPVSNLVMATLRLP